jgi:methionyl-tRNA synthetase
MNMVSTFGDWSGFNSPAGAVLLAGVLLWSLFWKGCALWHAARRGDAWWFTGILLINTAGIFEIIYLFGFAKLKAGQLFGDGSR